MSRAIPQQINGNSNSFLDFGEPSSPNWRICSRGLSFNRFIEVGAGGERLPSGDLGCPLVGDLPIDSQGVGAQEQKPGTFIGVDGRNDRGGGLGGVAGLVAVQGVVLL